MPSYKIDWGKNWDTQVVEAAEKVVKSQAVQATQVARAALSARFPGISPSVIWNTLDWKEDSDGVKYLEVGYRQYHTDFGHAFYETGNQHYAPNPLIVPTVLNHFN